MNWLSSENILAVVTALVGVGSTLGAVWYERRPRRPHIGYRVQMDTLVKDIRREDEGSLNSTATAADGAGAADGGDPAEGDNATAAREAARLGILNPGLSLTDPTLVLLRIENDGPRPISFHDYTGLSGLVATFEDRRVHGCAVVSSGVTAQDDHLTEARGLHHEANTLRIPRVPLNPGDHFKLLVLLDGGHEGAKVTVTGGLTNGSVSANESTSTSIDTPQRHFSRPAQILVTVLTLCLVALAGVIVSPAGDGDGGPAACPSGDVTLVASTAFESTATGLRDAYAKECPATEIEVVAKGSGSGIQDLEREGANAKNGKAPSTLVVTDGRSAGDTSILEDHRLSVSVFGMVVNEDVPVENLTVRQIRDVYAGRITDWSELTGGASLPVVHISRTSDSGTRDIFQRTVLGGQREGLPYSVRCDGEPEAGQTVERCELDSTPQVLGKVESTPGAIGYSELSAAEGHKGVKTLKIDGRAPSVDDIHSSGYPFRDVEYAWTYGTPVTDSALARFLDFLTERFGAAERVMNDSGQLPCVDENALQICARSGADGPPADQGLSGGARLGRGVRYAHSPELWGGPSSVRPADGAPQR